jgi:hypothetical protein
VYRRSELRALTAADAPRLGLCPACLGYGTTGELAVSLDGYHPYRVDEIEDPCAECGGSGRPYVKVTIRHDNGQITGHMDVARHLPVYRERGLAGYAVLPDGLCLACGMHPEIHPDPEPDDDERG